MSPVGPSAAFPNSSEPGSFLHTLADTVSQETQPYNLENVGLKLEQLIFQRNACVTVFMDLPFPTISTFFNTHVNRQACSLHPNEYSLLCTLCSLLRTMPVTQRCFSHSTQIHRHCQKWHFTFHSRHVLYGHHFLNFVQNIWKKSDKRHVLSFMSIDRLLSLHKWIRLFSQIT